MKRCTRCLLPQATPGSGFDKHGVCAPCRAFGGEDRAIGEVLRAERERDLEETLRTCRGPGAYDCLVNLSGGKDSCYLLYRIVREYGLRVLAFTTNMNIPPVAWENIRRTINALGVDHLVYSPPQEFYRKFFRHLLKNQNPGGAVRSVCYVCAPLFEGYSLRVAVERRIPLVLAGYSPGQPDPGRMVYEFSREKIAETDWTPPELERVLEEKDRALFWDPRSCPAGTRFPRYLAPFHAWRYHQAEVMEKVVELGLISNRKHANPIHSNCPINWLLMYSDLKNLGYNPYAPEFSQLIREGRANRRTWRILGWAVDFMIRHRILLGRNVTRSLEWLGLKSEDLKITRAGV